MPNMQTSQSKRGALMKKGKGAFPLFSFCSPFHILPSQPRWLIKEVGAEQRN